MIEYAEKFVLSNNINIIYLPGIELEAKGFWEKIGFVNLHFKKRGIHLLDGDTFSDYGTHWVKRM